MGIIRKEQRERMRDYLVQRIEENGNWDILSADETDVAILKEQEDSSAKPIRVRVLLHSMKRSSNELNHIISANYKAGFYVANLFYKDYENFFDRLGARANFKGDGKTLKHYTDGELRRTIHLRDLEKRVWSFQSGDTGLVYYQPNTIEDGGRLVEGLRTFDLLPVILDYTHLPEGDMGRAEGDRRASVDYKIVQDEGYIEGPIRFKRTSAQNNSLAIIPRANNQ